MTSVWQCLMDDFRFGELVVRIRDNRAGCQLPLIDVSFINYDANTLNQFGSFFKYIIHLPIHYSFLFLHSMLSESYPIDTKAKPKNLNEKTYLPTSYL